MSDNLIPCALHIRTVAWSDIIQLVEKSDNLALFRSCEMVRKPHEVSSDKLHAPRPITRAGDGADLIGLDPGIKVTLENSNAVGSVREQNHIIAP